MDRYPRRMVLKTSCMEDDPERVDDDRCLQQLQSEASHYNDVSHYYDVSKLLRRFEITTTFRVFRDLESWRSRFKVRLRWEQ